ncbi:uncharacterized protein LOC115929720 [Strongylocentrotus purpuratus]|uniref:Laminin G domain-containing protein n=1 Tax=Strongylocentrotus purpuratus TaxID=7668 RepID=A0A7M7PRR2_STRPU|nr:uncharacterized protein LOC115929720 [Strongylocentrotus purpuratus]
MPYSYRRDGVTTQDSLEFSGLNLEDTEDRDWHTFTLDIQGNLAILYADCTRVGLQIMYGSFVYDVTPDQYSLRLGKGLKGRKDVPDFKGIIEDVKFIFGQRGTRILRLQGCDIEASSSQSSSSDISPDFGGQSHDSQLSPFGKYSLIQCTCTHKTVKPA